MKPITLPAILIFLTSGLAAADKNDMIVGFLEQGQLAEGRKALEAGLATGKNDELQFQLGIVQFFAALEKLEQDWYRFGLHDSIFGELIPFLRLPVPQNPKPERVTNELGRKAIADFVQRLGEVTDTLAKVGDDGAMKVTLRPGMVRLDLNGDGKVEEEETLWKIYEKLVPGAPLEHRDVENFVVKLDLGDVRWLQGYCHLLAAIGDVFLAHDTERLFQHTAPLFFSNADTPFDFLRKRKQAPENSFVPETTDLIDGITFIHLLNFPVKEPQRMTSALHHLEEVTKLSRASWKAILAETDDEHEWIPNPKQTGVLGNAKVTPEMVQGWFAFLDEVDAILAGKKLLPFWRDAGGRGINLRRVFTEPKTLDVILWVQGTAAVPYLEQGAVTSPDFWATTDKIFRGEFLGFAIWFN